MADRRNFLLGFGERLTENITHTQKPGEKIHPYTFADAMEYLTPRIDQATAEMDDLPSAACPRNQAVATLTLHPTYLAKTYFPDKLLNLMEATAVGSKPRKLAPRDWGKTRHPDIATTAEIFIAGDRESFRRFSQNLRRWTSKSQGADDLVKIEDFRLSAPSERIKPVSGTKDELTFEVVLHATGLRQHDYIISGFKDYLSAMDIEAPLERRFYANGLCFLALRAQKNALEYVAKYSFLRAVREMPKMRSLKPTIRSYPREFCIPCDLPTDQPLDDTIRVAVFDGGLSAPDILGDYVRAYDTKDISSPDPDSVIHGTGVTSALLFGPIRDGVPLPRPYASIDHYRVLDSSDGDDEILEHVVLDRIVNVLETHDYQFVNLSLGPEIPIEDDDVHSWTAVLDQIFASGKMLVSIAAGNGGTNDVLSGNARIQTPADCVNAISVGAADVSGTNWQRANYSSIGPGRSPGVVKPDVLAFGGSASEPYWVIDAENPGYAAPRLGTSFASPTVLRAAVGIRAHFGQSLSPVALKSLLVHSCTCDNQNRLECGWGRISDSLDDITVCDSHSVRIVYQGELRPAKWVRMGIPTPPNPMEGMVTLAATFCITAETDPQDPINYTRAGLDIIFRPHEDKRSVLGQLYADTDTFFRYGDIMPEKDLRENAHKWETTLHKCLRKRGSSIKNPVFDVHYNAREGGGPAGSPSHINYALVLTLSAPRVDDLYNQVLLRYRTVLEPLVPIIEMPIPISAR